MLGERFNAMAARIQDSLLELAQRVAEAQSANDAEVVVSCHDESRCSGHPLNAISGYTELIELGVRGPVTELQCQDLMRIRRNGQHLLSLINNVLNLSRIEAGHLSLDIVDLSVDALMAETEALIAPQVTLKSLHYSVRVEHEGLSVVRADNEKLQQVLVEPHLERGAVHRRRWDGDAILSRGGRGSRAPVGVGHGHWHPG